MFSMRYQLNEHIVVGNSSTCQVGVIIRNSCEWFPLLFHYLVSTNIQPCMFVQLRDTCYAKFLYSFVAVQAKYELSLKS